MGDNKITNYLRSRSRSKQCQTGIINEEKLSTSLLNAVESLVIILDAEGRIVEFNPACERLTGYTKGEVLGKVFDFLIPADELSGVQEVLGAVVSNEWPTGYENHWLTKDGKKRMITWSITTVTNEDDHVKFVVATGMDVTEIKLQEKRRVMMAELFTTLAHVDNQDEILYRILYLFLDYSKCDAAGLRLRKGDDYPYAQTIGFTEDFVQAENVLCSLESRKTISEGECVALDCMCGRVIRGDLDCSLVPVTAGGAFITGNMNELAAKLAGKKLPFTLRNHCGKMGFNSMALIPLCFQGETVGLLQLNDQNTGKFSEEDIDFLTVAGRSIGAVLVRFQAEEARRSSEHILNALVEKARDGFSIGTPDGEMMMYNKSMERISGYTAEEVTQHGWFYLVFPNEEERRQAVQKARLVMAGKLDYLEAHITRKDGEKIKVAFSLSPIEIDGKSYNFSTMIDLSKKYDKL
jgi:PAS domain S-box-containing protein